MRTRFLQFFISLPDGEKGGGTWGQRAKTGGGCRAAEQRADWVRNPRHPTAERRGCVSPPPSERDNRSDQRTQLCVCFRLLPTRVCAQGALSAATRIFRRREAAELKSTPLVAALAGHGPSPREITPPHFTPDVSSALCHLSIRLFTPGVF